MKTKPSSGSASRLRARFGDVEKATLASEVPDPGAYLYELKYDGYRFLALKSGEGVQLLSRKGLDWADRFPGVVAAIRALEAKEVVLDGEVCALDARGVPSFGLMQNATGMAGARFGRTGGATRSEAASARSARSEKGHVVYVAFDLLWREGEDLRGLPLEKRRRALEIVVPRNTKSVLSVSSAVEADPREVLRLACGLGFEGIVAKRRDSVYVSGRTKDWLKVKCTQRQEFAILGYVPYVDSDAMVGALLLGVREGGEFRFAGKVGTGFDAATRSSLAKKLNAHRVPSAAFPDPPREPGAHWVRPTLVAEVAFSEWTAGARVRHASFQGLRVDKTPEECVREVPTTGLGSGAGADSAARASSGARSPDRRRVKPKSLGAVAKSAPKSRKIGATGRGSRSAAR